MADKPSYEQLEQKVAALEKKAQEQAFSEKLTRTLFDISNAVNTTTDLNELYHSIYRSLDRLMGLPNFYIAIFKKDEKKISIPFFVDQFDGYSEYEDYFTETNSLTGEVIGRQTPLLLNEQQLIKRANEGRILGTTPKIWLGVPLVTGKKPIGIIAVQSYDNPKYFTRNDLDILISVSNQIALAVERKQAQQERNLLENYLYNIINFMPSILVGVDQNGRVTQWNSQAESETGITADQARSKPVEQVFPRLSSCLPEIKDSIRNNRIKTLLKQEHQKENRTRFEDIIIYPISTDQVNGAVIRIDDITEHTRLEEMMIQSEKMMSLGGLAAGMAHEINNPLAGMMQNAQVVVNRMMLDIPANEKAAGEAGITMDQLRDYIDRREIRQKLDLINTAGSQAARIVKNMLSFARKSDTVAESADVAQLLKKSVELAGNDYNLEQQYDFKRIQIREDYAPSLPRVLCDKSKIQQVFLNILKNGAQAMSIRQNKETPPCFQFSTYQDGDYVCIRIHNNGPHIGETEQKRLFEPFYTTKAVGEGTGLGMSVSYFIIVTDHKGKLLVESSPGNGTAFIVKLPV